jgi:Flp pilus assembly protein TadD
MQDNDAGSEFSQAIAQAHHCHQAGNLSEAEHHLRRALELTARDAETWCHLGVVCHAQGKLDEATAYYQEALRLKPDYAAAHNNLGVAWGIRGLQEEAVACYERALQLRPQDPEALSNLGFALYSQGRLDEAAQCCLRAIELRPDHSNAHNNLGLTLYRQGRLLDAIECYHRALQHVPARANVLSNLGMALETQGKLDQAAACYTRALEVEPDLADSHLNRATLWLLQGRFELGWPEYEWRWRCGSSKMRTFSQPRWKGEALEGRAVLLHAEQGLGDTIHFIRYASLVRERGGRVIVECQQALVALLATCGAIDVLVGQGADLPAFDVHIPLLSLPLVAGTTLASIPAKIPYLAAEDGLVEGWRYEVEALPAFRVGIAWQGNPRTLDDRYRSIPLNYFATLARVEGVRLISLQKGPGAEQLRQLHDRFPVVDWSDMLDETSGPFMDTAALMKSLDLVITSDTVVAHLAGALGIPVWVMLQVTPDWRWLLDREDSPWYPTMRLFRQRQPGDWGDVFARIADQLKVLAATRAA